MPFTFTRRSIPDVVLVCPKVFHDERGFFGEIFKAPDFKDLGIHKPIAQINYSKSKQGVFRGLHYQKEPMAQAKIVRVLVGEILDIALDLRRSSPTYGRHTAVTLSAGRMSMLYIPEGFAHGFYTLSGSAEVEYLCTQVYSPAHERGVLYSDPALGIQLPSDRPVLSEKDGAFPLFSDAGDHFA